MLTNEEDNFWELNLDANQVILAAFKYYFPRRTVSAKVFAEGLRRDFSSLPFWAQDVISSHVTNNRESVGYNSWWDWLNAR